MHFKWWAIYLPLYAQVAFLSLWQFFYTTKKWRSLEWRFGTFRHLVEPLNVTSIWIEGKGFRGTRAGYSEEGIHLAAPGLLRPFCRPLFIPWSAVRSYARHTPYPRHAFECFDVATEPATTKLKITRLVPNEILPRPHDVDQRTTLTV